MLHAVAMLTPILGCLHNDPTSVITPIKTKILPSAMRIKLKAIVSLIIDSHVKRIHAIDVVKTPPTSKALFADNILNHKYHAAEMQTKNKGMPNVINRDELSITMNGKATAQIINAPPPIAE